MERAVLCRVSYPPFTVGSNLGFYNPTGGTPVTLRAPQVCRRDKKRPSITFGRGYGFTREAEVVRLNWTAERPSVTCGRGQIREFLAGCTFSPVQQHSASPSGRG